MKTHTYIATTVSAIAILVVVIGQGIVSAQGSSATSTPPAPPPTASAAPQVMVTNTPRSNAGAPPLTTSFTQADLKLLTGNVQRPNGLVWFDGKLFAACTGDWTIYEIDAETGVTAQYIYGPKNAHAMVAKAGQSNTSLWIPDFQSNTVIEITQGVVKTVASNMEGPWGIVAFDDTQFLVTNLRGNNVVLVGAAEPKQVISQLRSPTGIALDDGYIYVANTGSARRAIEWYSTDGLVEQTEPIDAEAQNESHALVSGLQNVTNITMAADDLLYFSYSLGTRGVVGRVNPETCRENGGCSSEQVEIVVYSELAAPLSGLTISSDMELFIHSIFSPEIYWVDLTTTPTGN
ncbi:MAG: hypothetical protein LCI00_03635 [Chloroflexi bacterium]|nr:hypothetical protein [Chloroflexota bacterium]MCC6891285.1 hypothetical protein [Anaerolineae bacterium]